MSIRYFFLMIALCLAGCATPEAELITYSGSRRADDSVAMLKAQMPLSIVAIDGNADEHVYPGTRRNRDTTIYLEPGEHRLTFAYRAGQISSKMPTDLDVSLRAGHRYFVIASATRPSFWLGRGGTWRPVLEDVTDHPEQWQ